MKNLFLFILLIIMQMTSYSQKINSPKVTKVKLNNGLVLLLSEDKKLPLIQFRLILNGGVRLDEGFPAGLTSLTLEMLTKGTKNKTADEIANSFENLGSLLNTNTTYDFSTLSTEVLKENFQNAIEIISDILINPVFPKNEFDKLIQKRLSDIDAILEEPRSIISYAVPTFLYKNTPYEKNINGNKTSLKKINPEMVKSHYKKFFNASNAVIVLYGDFEKDNMIKLIEKYFGNWNSGNKLEEKQFTNEYIKGKNIIIIDKPDVTQTQIRFLNKGVDIKNPDNFAIQVANVVFGNGFTSRLVNEIRVKRSLSYGANSQFVSQKYAGGFIISTFTKNETVDQVFEIIFNELEKYIKEGPTQQEIDKAKKYLIGNFVRNLQSPEMLISQLGNIYIYDLPEDYLETYAEKVNKLTNEEIMSAIKKYFPVDDILMLIVSNKQYIEPRIEKFGKIQTLTLKELVN